MRASYQAMSMDERRAWWSTRDPEKVRAADRERYRRDYDKRRAAAEAYAKAHPEVGNAAKRRWSERNPEKRKASVTLNNAVRDGRLKKEPCEVCGSTYRIHGHHEDYAKPLDVHWLCPLHHVEAHRAA